ncbi:unnamed protein product [Moneuplotes crassus]|uniref:Uncharacterized protein n=1 Tax=Euplotes crassus TaxID=5936 RepID=A0AAD1XQ97_EUPCR|nr:unnamed protein product [Moneuplotes crassus]
MVSTVCRCNITITYVANEAGHFDCARASLGDLASTCRSSFCFSALRFPGLSMSFDLLSPVQLLSIFSTS